MLGLSLNAVVHSSPIKNMCGRVPNWNVCTSSLGARHKLFGVIGIFWASGLPWNICPAFNIESQTDVYLIALRFMTCQPVKNENPGGLLH